MATAIKYPKDGKPYKSVTLNPGIERLKEFYNQHPFEQTEPHEDNIRTFRKHPLPGSLFSSLMPYFELQEGASGRSTFHENE